MAAEHDAHVLAIDVGNTTTRFGMMRVAAGAGSAGAVDSHAEARAPEALGTCEITTRQPITADEARIQLVQALDMLPRCTVAGTILSCVVPSLTDVWRRALAQALDVRPYVVGPGLKSGIKLRFKDPGEVGPDRIADAVAARAAVGAPAIVIDLGTTTNFEAIDASGAFCGGIIAPGVSIGAQSLARAAARLPVIELKTPARVLGRTTREAMQSGVVLGEAVRIDGLIDAIRAELLGDAAGDGAAAGRRSAGAAAGDDANGGAADNVATSDAAACGAHTATAGGTNDAAPSIPIVITGENAAAMAALLHHEVTVDDTLTLRGLALIWQNNQR